MICTYEVKKKIHQVFESDYWRPKNCLVDTLEML